jgi:hypothetical protein
MVDIKLKKSSVVGRVPGSSDLAYGELAINYADGRLFYKDASNGIKAFIDSASTSSLVTTTIDSDYINARVASLDSSQVTSIVDSDYVLNRTSSSFPILNQDSSLSHYQKFTFTVVSQNGAVRLQPQATYLDSVGTSLLANIDLATPALDSSSVISLIDSAYVNARVSATDSAAVISLITGTVNNAYVQSRQKIFIDSALSGYRFMDSGEVISLVDSAYITARTPPSTDSAATIALITSTVDSAYVTLRAPAAGGGSGSSAVNQIKVNSYTGDSSTVSFTLSEAPASGSENSVIVTINGVAQHVNSYSLSGSNIILDSAPETGDEIEMRVHSDVIAQNLISAVDSDFTTITANQIVDTFTKTLYRTTKYIAQIEHDSNNKYHSEEILLTHNGTTVAMTTYAQLLLDSNLGSFDADISGSLVRLKFTPTYTNTSVKLRAIRTSA